MIEQIKLIDWAVKGFLAEKGPSDTSLSEEPGLHLQTVHGKKEPEGSNMNLWARLRSSSNACIVSASNPPANCTSQDKNHEVLPGIVFFPLQKHYLRCLWAEKS
uniref:Uncharacterized protein n=1 Tax=Salix viminalis TaxID=40686 RepID=A0A6N2N446_SALVM